MRPPKIGKQPLTRRRMAATLSPGRGQVFFGGRGGALRAAAGRRKETLFLLPGEKVAEGRRRMRGLLFVRPL